MPQLDLDMPFLPEELEGLIVGVPLKDRTERVRIGSRVYRVQGLRVWGSKGLAPAFA